MKHICLLVLIALGVAGLTKPGQASMGYQDGRRSISPATEVDGAPPLAPEQTPAVSVLANAGSVTGAWLQPFGTSCYSAIPEVPGDICWNLEGHLGYGAQDAGGPGAGEFRPIAQGFDLEDVGGLLSALQAPVASQSSVRAQASVAAQDPDRWLFSLTAYLWFPTTSATLTAGPLSTSFSVGPFQYGIPFGLMGHFDAMKGKWGLFGDLVYSNAFYGGVGDRNLTSVGATVWIGEYGVSYRLGGPQLNLADWGAGKQPPAFDAYIGGRTFSITQTITQSLPNLGRTVSASSSSSFTSPLVGLRARFDLSDKWSLLLDGNIGGFGVDNTSFAWGAIAVFSYKMKFFDLPAALDIGARALYMNLQSSDQTFQANQTLYGPLVGLTVFW